MRFLNGEDSLVLNLLVEKKYKEILNTYPNSPFYESVLSFYATKSYRPKYIKNYYLKEDILRLYKSFFYKFPDSYYGFNITFVGSLFTKLIAYTNDLNSMIQELKEEYYNTGLFKYLNQKELIKLFKPYDDYSRKAIQENERNLGKNEIFDGGD